MMRYPSGKEQIHAEPESEGRQEIVIKSIFAPFLLPFKMMLFIFRLLFFIGGWGMVVTGYCAVLGTGMLGLIGLWAGAANPGNGLGASLFGFGCGFFALGLALVAWTMTNAAAGGFIRMASGRMRRLRLPEEAELRTARRKGRPDLIHGKMKWAAILLGAGILTGGIGVLAGGDETIELPSIPFLKSIEFKFDIGQGT